MMTIASSAKAAMKQALKWGTLAGAALVIGQAECVGGRYSIGADEAEPG